MTPLPRLAGALLVLVLLAWWPRLPPLWRARRRARSLRLTGAPPDVPVILVPGILGTLLVDPAYRNFAVWGSYQGGFCYRDRYEDLDLPITPGGSNRLQPGEVL